MKNISILLLIIFFAVSCNSPKTEDQPASDEQQQEQVQDSEVNTSTKPEIQSAKATPLNTAEYKLMVHNFTANPKWKFEGELPCIVDFYADWCAPCRQVAPIMDELAKEYAGKINVYKVNVDFEGELSNFYRVQSIPTVMFCTADNEPVTKLGAFSKQDYIGFIESYLLK